MVLLGGGEVEPRGVAIGNDRNLCGAAAGQGSAEPVEDVEDVDAGQQLAGTLVHDGRNLLEGDRDGGVTGADPAVAFQTLATGTNLREIKDKPAGIRLTSEKFTGSLGP